MATTGGGPPQGPVVNEELAQNIKAAKAASEALTDSFRSQLKIVQELQATILKISESMQAGTASITTSATQASEQVNHLTEELKKQKNETKKATTEAEKMAKVFKTVLSKSADVAAAGVAGLVKGFKNFVALGKGVLGFVGSLTSGLFSIGKAVLAIPFKMMQGLFEMAESGGGGTELADAYERVRESFGNLKTGTSKDIIDVASSMGKLDSTGVSAQRVFGNLAQRIDAMNKLAQGMGATIGHFTDELRTNGEALARYQRGLGMNEEQMESVNRMAMRTGTSATKVLIDMTKQSQGMSKAFGINAKVLSKDMAKAMQDVAHFGHLSSKEIGLAAAYANKLGISVDKLTASMDATATFDQAAESMGRLNETFGTNIDATEVMMAQTPQEKFEKIRKALLATGKDMTKLNYQERMLLKQQTGWDDAALDAAVSTKNLGVSLDKMSAVATKNEDKVMSQTEALKALSDQIVRLNVAAEGGKGGIFDRFLEGISKGIQSTPEFLAIMRNIKQVFAGATQSGMKLGKMFVDLFPGVRETFQGIADLFEPARFRKFFDGIIKAFEVFKKGGTGKIDDFMMMIKDNFFSFFDDKKDAGKKILDGMKKFFGIIIEVISKLAVFAIKELAKVLTSLTEWMKNPEIPQFKDSGKWTAILQPLMEVFKTAKDVLWPVIKDFGAALWEQLKKALFDTKAGNALIAGSLAVILGPAIINSIVALVSGGIFKKSGAILAGGAGSQLGPMAGRIAKGENPAAVAAEQAQAAMQAAGKETAGMASSPSQMMSTAIPDADTQKKMEKAAESGINWEKLKIFLVGLAGVFAIGLGAFTVALRIVKNQSAEDLIKAGIVLTSLVPVIAAAGMLAWGLSKAEDVDFNSVLRVIAGIAMVMAVGLASFYVALKVAQKFEAADILKAAFMLNAMVPVMLAATLVAAAATQIGKVDLKTTALGIVAIGAVVLATAGLAYLSTKALGELKISEITTTIYAMASMELLMLGASVLALAAAGIGAIIIKTGGVGAGAIALGLLALGVVLAAVGAVAWGAIKVLGKFSLGEIAATYAAMSAFELLFLGAAGLALAAVPAAVAGLLAIPGLAVISLFMGAVGLAAYAAIKNLGGFSKDQIGSAYDAMKSFELLFLGAAMLAVAAAGVAVIGLLAIPGLVIIGTMMAGVGLAAWATIKAFKDFKKDQIDVAAGVMKSFIDVFSAVASLAVSAAAVGVLPTKSIIAGGITIGAASYAIGKGGQKVIDSLKGITIQDSANVIVVMSVLNDIFSAASKLLISAFNIGTLIISSLGVGGLALIIGMQTIENAVGTLVTTGLSIIVRLSEIKDDPSAVAMKANAFNSIISAISAMLKSVGEIIGKLDFGFFSDPIGVKMGQVENFIDTLISGSDGQGGIIGIVSKVTQALQEVPKDKLEAGKAFADILKGLGDFMGAITAPALEVSKKAGGLLGTSVDDLEKILNYMLNFIVRVGASAANVLTQIVAVTSASLKGMGKEQLDAIPAVGGLLKAVTEIVSAVSKATSTEPVGKVDNAAMMSVVAQVPTIGTLLDEISRAAPKLIASLLATVAAVPNDKGLKDKVGTISSVMELFVKMTKLTEIFKGAPPGTNPTDTIAETLTTLQSIAILLAGVHPAYPNVSLAILGGMLKLVTVDKDIETKGKSIVGALESVKNVANAIKDPFQGMSKEGTTPIETMQSALSGMLQVFNLLAGKKPDGSAEGTIGLGKIVDAISKIDSSLPKGYVEITKAVDKSISSVFVNVNSLIDNVKKLQVTDAAAIGTNIDNVQSFVNTLPDKMKGVATAFDTFAKKKDEIKIGSIKPVIEAVQDMVTKTRELDQALSALPKFDIPTKLEAIAKGMGVGGKFSYTVQSKEIVINVNFTVTMEADAVEKAIVYRSNSIIRDRLNFAMGSGQGKNAQVSESLTVGNRNPGFKATDVAG